MAILGQSTGKLRTEWGRSIVHPIQLHCDMGHDSVREIESKYCANTRPKYSETTKQNGGEISWSPAPRRNTAAIEWRIARAAFMCIQLLLPYNPVCVWGGGGGRNDEHTGPRMHRENIRDISEKNAGIAAKNAGIEMSCYSPTVNTVR